MNCVDVLEDLDGSVDRTLSGSRAREVEKHLAHCASCREEERRLRALFARTAALPRSIEPTRDLWDNIAYRLERRTERSHTAGPFRWWDWKLGLAAASVLLAAGVGSWMLLPQQRPSPPGLTPGSGPGPRLATHATETVRTAAPPSGLAPADLALYEARQQLRAALYDRREFFSPETVRKVDENLLIIERAIQEIQSALEKDPGNRELRRMLMDTRQREVTLLRRVTQTAALR